MRTLISSIALLTIISSLSACGAASADDDDASSEGASAASTDPRISIAKNAGAIVFTENGQDTAIGAPAKIKAALGSIDGPLRALEGAPRCGPPRFFLTINGADNKKIATINVCGTDKAFLQSDAKWFEVPFEESALRDVLAKKPAVGDLLAMATDVTVTTPDAARGSESGERQSPSTFKKGFDLDAVPELSAANDNPPSELLMTLRFAKGSTEVATIAIAAPANDNDTEAPAMLSVRGRRVGWVTFDIARAIGSF